MGAACFFNVVMTSSFAAKMGIQIRDSVLTCESPDKENSTRICAVDILSVIASFGLASNFLTSAVTACPPDSDQVHAPCASKIITLISTITAASAAAVDYKACAEHVSNAQEDSEN